MRDVTPAAQGNLVIGWMGRLLIMNGPLAPSLAVLDSAARSTHREGTVLPGLHTETGQCCQVYTQSRDSAARSTHIYTQRGDSAARSTHRDGAVLPGLHTERGQCCQVYTQRRGSAARSTHIYTQRGDSAARSTHIYTQRGDSAARSTHSAARSTHREGTVLPGLHTQRGQCCQVYTQRRDSAARSTHRDGTFVVSDAENKKIK